MIGAANWPKERIEARQRGEPLAPMTEADKRKLALLKFMFGDYADDVLVTHRCTVCEAEAIGDRPDCPEDGVHCNIVEKE